MMPSNVSQVIGCCWAKIQLKTNFSSELYGSSEKQIEIWFVFELDPLLLWTYKHDFERMYTVFLIRSPFSSFFFPLLVSFNPGFKIYLISKAFSETEVETSIDMCILVQHTAITITCYENTIFACTRLNFFIILNPKLILLNRT